MERSRLTAGLFVAASTLFFAPAAASATPLTDFEIPASSTVELRDVSEISPLDLRFEWPI